MIDGARRATVDGNEATAAVAYALSETIAIYPITPSSPMAESCDEWAAKSRTNIWGTVPRIIEMQSEGGAAGAVHGMLQAGALSTTFTASQGLLLMIPNFYKIAGELLPFVAHVAARTLATHALSIFGDHSDVMACRQIGMAMLCSGNVQETQDMAAIAHAATLRTRVPFIHFFDGFRTSHEVGKIELLTDDLLRRLVREEDVDAFRRRALTPDAPVIRGTAQNPDTFFQAREACNPFHAAVPGALEEIMAGFASLTGRSYRLFEYEGDPRAERVIVIMGSGAETSAECSKWLNCHGQKTGVLKVRLFRPWSVQRFAEALPDSVKAIAVLDRTKEPGSVGEPLYQDVVTSLAEARAAGLLPRSCNPVVVGGRYGLSSKEFTPAMAKAVFDELKSEAPRNHFTVGIMDDVSGTSLPWDREWDIEPDEVTRAVFYGLGSDGTVGANKNTIKIIGEGTDNYAQGYFVYDSKKAGAVTVSHLRFGPHPIRSTYLVSRANFVGVHQWEFFDKLDVLDLAAPGAVVLVNSVHGPDAVWSALPREAQEIIVARKLRLYTIDAYNVARETGMGGRINTIMQTCFFAISGVLPRDEAIAQIKKAIEKTYARKGAEVVQKNFAAVDATLAALHEVPVPAAADATRHRPPVVPEHAPDFVKRVTAVMLEGKGDLLPVSAFPVDGNWPMGTTKWEKRNLAQEIPVWDADLCIQCNKCVLVCPHAAVRAKFYEPSALEHAPETFKHAAFRSTALKGMDFTIQIAPEDCTGCTLCVQVCPAKDKANPRHKALDMAPQHALREQERRNYEFFLALPEPDRRTMKAEVKATQFFEPLIEYSGACAGCGETPYLKLLTQMYGDRLFIANATGCSSIYGGNLPTTPYTTNREGRGPAWSNSLFEDNAEYGLGMRIALDKHHEHACELLKKLAPQVGDELVAALLAGYASDEETVAAQRERVRMLRSKLAGSETVEARRLSLLADYLVKKSVWIVGGDGWAYDIGFGGLDHVLWSGRDVNILVMDTEVYSNTGGQSSKATPLGATAKFAVSGKELPKKDLALYAMMNGTAYVARVAFGAKDGQTVQAFAEAESFPGVSLIVAYSHCIAHGYGMHHGLEQQKLAVDSAYWPLFRFNPRRTGPGEEPLKLDSGPPKVPLSKYLANELRYRALERVNPEHAKQLQEAAQRHVQAHFAEYERLRDAMKVPPEPSAN
ncbi:MAG: pyruvate:ferredoxin (flavodoxin) oxidoreductase [Chthoniobacterales bacterium]|nr:pyruvate:ferredoxin (flavodoxin) oxidoreductase [Chthoniobacterales bacterium]